MSKMCKTFGSNVRHTSAQKMEAHAGYPDVPWRRNRRSVLDGATIHLVPQQHRPNEHNHVSQFSQARLCLKWCHKKALLLRTCANEATTVHLNGKRTTLQRKSTLPVTSVLNLEENTSNDVPAGPRMCAGTSASS